MFSFQDDKNLNLRPSHCICVRSDAFKTKNLVDTTQIFHMVVFLFPIKRYLSKLVSTHMFETSSSCQLH